MMASGERLFEHAIPLDDCAALREVTGDCPMVVLTATDLEAEPLRAAMVRPRHFKVAGKTVYVGELADSGSGETGVEGAGAAGTRLILAVSGCDKVNTAVTLTCLLQAMTPRPRLVVQVGIAGAFPAGGIARDVRPGDVIVATQESYSDTGSSSPCGWIAAAELGLSIAEVDGVELGGVFPAEPGLVEWASDTLTGAGFSGAPGHGEVKAEPALWQGPCVTSSMVTGRDDEARTLAQRWGALAESMEGAAAAHVCALYGVPFLEVRGISNLVGDRDRPSWLVQEAVDSAGRAALALVRARVAGTCE